MAATTPTSTSASAQTGMQCGAVSIPCTVPVSMPELAMPTNSASVPLLQAATEKTATATGKTAAALQVRVLARQG